MAALAGHLYQRLAPAAPAPEDTLRACLEQLDGVLPEDESDRGRLIAILRSALARWSAGAAPVADGADGASAAAKVGSASDEEIFAFIDNDL